MGLADVPGVASSPLTAPGLGDPIGLGRTAEVSARGDDDVVKPLPPAAGGRDASGGHRRAMTRHLAALHT